MLHRGLSSNLSNQWFSRELPVWALAAMVLVALSGCGETKTSESERTSGSGDGSRVEKSENFKYTFSINGCSTGEQSFDSKDKMCATLQDDEANNQGCAQSMREDYFKAHCPGTFQAKAAPVKSASKPREYSYQFTVNGCDTGQHSFDTLIAYCASLLEEKVNKGCALEARHSAYEQNCELGEDLSSL